MQGLANCRERGRCDYSPTENMCETLDRAGVPHDPKWRTFILYSRTLETHSLLSREQRGRLQSLVLRVIREKDYSEESYRRLLEENQQIVCLPYIEKLREAVRESEVLLQEFREILQQRRGDVSSLGGRTIKALEKGDDPKVMLSMLRSAFKDVIDSMTRDEKRLESLSKTDALTNMANRRAFDEYLTRSIDQARQRGTPLSLLMCDIDFFKKFNDVYGHRIGDQALATVAKNIREHLDKSGLPGLAARYGGEEFAVILTGSDAVEAVEFAETLRRRIENYNFVIRDSTGGIVKDSIRITVSIGVGELEPGWGDDSRDLVARLIDVADAGLYAAKHDGRNLVRMGNRKGE